MDEAPRPDPRDDAATAAMREAMPLGATLGMWVVADDADPAVTRLALDWSPALCTTDGMLHGGAVMALADAAGGLCAFRHLPPDAAGTATIESKTNFLAAVRSGTVVATARPLKVGSSVIVVETEVRDGDGKLAAKVTQTQTVLRAR